jgi:hemerythrin-like metal-binding protein
MALIDVSDDRLILGVPAMDRTHREMADLVNRMADCSNASFVYLYPDLVSHTHTHFATEELLMRETRFPASAEHKSEHARVLGELHAFGQRLATGRIAMARAYVAEQLPAWFAVHLATMDSALAAHVSAGIKAKAQTQTA